MSFSLVGLWENRISSLSWPVRVLLAWAMRFLGLSLLGAGLIYFFLPLGWRIFWDMVISWLPGAFFFSGLVIFSRELCKFLKFLLPSGRVSREGWFWVYFLICGIFSGVSAWGLWWWGGLVLPYYSAWVELLYPR